MVNSPSYQPIYEFTRGRTVESIHFGAVAVVDVSGKLLASYGDPNAITFMRSAAKPFQAIPFFQNQGPEFYNLTTAENAIICASHSGTDEQLEVIRSIQKKVAIDESELLCGVHMPYHEPTADRIRLQHEALTPNRHNCSGKHSGMLAYDRLKRGRGEIIPADLLYIDPIHPIQLEIIDTIARISSLTVEQVATGIDGCSAPNFAIPLSNAALAYARLSSPENWEGAPESIRSSCIKIYQSMTTFPDMVAGPGRFDTRLMEVARGRLVSKSGAEGFQSIGLAHGALSHDSPAIGIAVKISDGDHRKQVRSAVVLEVLRQLGALSEKELLILQVFGPHFMLENAREITVGHGYPCFQLQHSSNLKTVKQT